MRTTIYISDDLLTEAKKVAAESQRTLTAVIEDSLRETLARRSQRNRSGAVRLTTFGKSGPKLGVDLDDTAALVELMEESVASDRR
ncbi:MAG: hypothetical protein PVF37_17645 [Desulfobacterales bacterium]|jgi:hypothetical protein